MEEGYQCGPQVADRQTMMDGKKKEVVFELCYSMPCPYRACDIAGLFVIAQGFFCEFHFLGDIFMIIIMIIMIILLLLYRAMLVLVLCYFSKIQDVL